MNIAVVGAGGMGGSYGGALKRAGHDVRREIRACHSRAGRGSRCLSHQFVTANGGARGCLTPSSPMCSRMREMTPGSVITAITRNSPPQ
jgi:hypothetical protein